MDGQGCNRCTRWRIASFVFFSTLRCTAATTASAVMTVTADVSVDAYGQLEYACGVKTLHGSRITCSDGRLYKMVDVAYSTFRELKGVDDDEVFIHVEMTKRNSYKSKKTPFRNISPICFRVFRVCP